MVAHVDNSVDIALTGPHDKYITMDIEARVTRKKTVPLEEYAESVSSTTIPHVN